MALPYSKPDPGGSERSIAAKAKRDLATEVARIRPSALTETNCEESDHASDDAAVYPANFTKGLLHDQDGLLAQAEDYRGFVKAINSTDRNLFETAVASAKDHGVQFNCKPKDGDSFGWRGWESPRAGHVYELQGVDPADVGMAPAPRIGSSELAAEMAEVYAMALLRDVPFTEICEGGRRKLCDDGGEAALDAATVAELLAGMRFFNPRARPKSSTPHTVDETNLNRFERRRRDARGDITKESLFRGSTKGAKAGPYISQFMLVGTDSLAGAGDGVANYPGLDAPFDLEDGYIPYGSLIIDQRTITHKSCLDHLTEWCAWLDVQNGADTRGTDLFEPERRFITTPRDLATYVHYDALYEAYLNAALIMLSLPIPASKGFPEQSPSGKRTAFATFGGPHVLSLVTEVATRCLKAVRRQKFNHHRRARPEAIGGRFTITELGGAAKLGCAGSDFRWALAQIPSELKKAIIEHNADQNTKAMHDMRRVECSSECPPPCDATPEALADANLLLPMAFPEGSPMHPAYGAGHATVAGGCVTMLKAFFEMFEDCDSFTERPLLDREGNPIVYVPNEDGSALQRYAKEEVTLTVQGELDKLAANVSIGRNMAGVHYYSDYYDSLRMGERVAVSILLEQAPTYGDEVSMTFKSFDGDHVTLYGEAGTCPSLSIIDRNGNPVSHRDWWLRHVSGEEIILDL